MRAEQKLQGKVVVITGGSAGVGRATAEEFARQGAHLVLLARGRERLEEAQRELELRGVRVLTIPTDISDPEQVEVAAEQAEREFGRIDIWINCAMSTIFSHFADITPDEFKRSTEVTYLGAVYGTMAALKRMRRRNRGTIVQVGSALAYRAIPLQAPYCGAKHAIRGFTDSLRCELLHERSRIHLTAVHLPAVNTPQFSWCKTKLPRHPQPVPPIFQPEIPARAIVWASTHRRREVLVGYPTVVTIWGNKFLPGLGDRYLAANGFSSQQTDEVIDQNRPSNLFEPVSGDYGAHGIFDKRATDSSWQFWLTRHRRTLATAALVLLGSASALGVRKLARS